MSFKTILHITLDDGIKGNAIELKREIFLMFVPHNGMKIQMDFKDQHIIDVVYDFDRETFDVEFKDDDSLTFGFSNSTNEQLAEEYLKKGWKRLVSLDLDERVKNLKISSAVSEIEYAIRDLEGDTSICKMSEIIVKFEMIRGVETERIFDMLRLSYPQRMLVLNDINRILSEKNITPDTDEELTRISYNKLLQTIKDTKRYNSRDAFIKTVSNLIFDSGIKQSININQVFYFTQISPEDGSLIKNRLKELRKQGEK